MALEASHLEDDLIRSLQGTVARVLADEDPVAYREFVRQYYHWLPAQDLSDRRPDDLLGALVAHWRLARCRCPGEVKVRVHNVEPDRDGWSSPYTVIEVVSDDMPFIVDSVTMELSRQGYGIELMVHPVMRVLRDGSGNLVEVLEAGDDRGHAESIIHAEVGRVSDPNRHASLRQGLELVLDEVRRTVEDWPAMRSRALALAAELRAGGEGTGVPAPQSGAFLAWLATDNFTFLGYRDYELHDTQDGAELRVVKDSGLGILRSPPARPVTPLRGRALELARSPSPLVLTKANSRARVHRPAYLDYISVKRFSGSNGTAVTGERRFLGLYTTSAYKASPREIPLLRDKVQRVMTRAGFPPDSHDAKQLIDILESLPRDLLLQIDADQLFDLAIGIVGLGERQRVRLFVSSDSLDRFVDCTLCLPRDRFNTVNRVRAQRILTESFAGAEIDWRLHLSESVVVRLDYIVRCPHGVPDVDVAAIEARITEATRNWTDDLRAALVAVHGERRGMELMGRYRGAFPPGYRADQNADAAVADIERMQRMVARRRPVITLYRRSGDPDDIVRCQLLSLGRVSLSEVVPRFEHMGARVVDERPYEITPAGQAPVWIYDFGLACDAAGMARAGDRFADVFLAAWSGELEDDRLNGLVMFAGLTGREITLIRAILRYLRQATIAFSGAYMTQTLLAHPRLAVAMLELFRARFDPDARDCVRAEALAREIEGAIDAVQSLDEDRILRSFLAVIQATLRTNYYCAVGGDPDASPPYLSFKVDPQRLDMLPHPRPRYEIFVYSPRMEGIHLRGGKVARGGLRWSDRRADFRTEILGLMKAQMVKNALIVPVGSKGGFVAKQLPSEEGEARLQEGIACYRTFLRGLLDITDNYEGDQVVAPQRVVRYDDDDPYLVVAADKGTASFSDIANEISAEYGFWLGDAFASGGSNGYDHKEMGITARGAWESVRRHFRELGTDIGREPFTVVGIGDMSGDVFGNAMLLSPHIRLMAAFNRDHVFLDPDPDPALSFQERRRLFSLPISSWSDYDPRLISDGGGVYRRTAKSIRISAQAREALAIQEERLAPNELIRRLLCAPVDLLFNGGIGTYVKAREETHADVGDRAGDVLRVDANKVRCRVVGEGGNLGFTQRGRIEYALEGGPESAGGLINTDAIDNVAGVNCSDHEVNIKILLGELVTNGSLSPQERDDLLAQMTDAVAQHVIYGSYTQTEAISLSLSRAVSMLEVHGRLLAHLEAAGALDRELEALPSERAIAQRRTDRRGLVGPEVATLMAHTKIQLKGELLASDLPEDPDLVEDLARYFPPPLGQRYRGQMESHPLRRELICTIVANELVDRAGLTFAFRLTEETGVGAAPLVRAYTVAREVFEMRPFWREVEALDNEIDAGTQLAMLQEGRRLVERAARWLARSRRARPGHIGTLVAQFTPAATMLAPALPNVLRGQDLERFGERLAELVASGVPEALARRVASMQALLSVFDIVVDARATSRPQQVVMDTYFDLGARLGLDWLRDRILELPRDDRWQALARAALRDELYRLHRALTRDALAVEPSLPGDETSSAAAAWMKGNAEHVARALEVLDDVRASRIFDTTTLPVVIRELKNLHGDDYELS